MILAVVVIIIIVQRPQGITVQNLLTYTPESPALAFLFLCVLYCIKPVATFIPVTLLYIVTGIMFPTWQAILITYIGLMLEISEGYLVGRRLTVDKLLGLLGKSKRLTPLAANLQKGVEWLEPHKDRLPAFCFLSRVLPVPIPLDVKNVLFGSVGMGYFEFVIFSLLGFSPGMIPWVIAGNSIGTPWSKEFILPFVIALAISICALAVFHFLKEKHFFNIH